MSPWKTAGIWLALLAGMAAFAILSIPLIIDFVTTGFCWDCLRGIHHHCRDERPASARLKTIASAQADFRANDRDGNGKHDFWRGDIAGLYAIVPSGATEPLKLIEMSVAAADDRASSDAILRFATRGPKAGYWFRALRHVDEKDLDPNRFAACAFPADYPKSGRWTYVLDEGNTIYKRDLGRPGGIDVFPDGPTLRKEWAKLD